MHRVSYHVFHPSRPGKRLGDPVVKLGRLRSGKCDFISQVLWKHLDQICIATLIQLWPVAEFKVLVVICST